MTNREIALVAEKVMVRGFLNKKRFDLNKLIEFCLNEGVGFTANFSEPDELELRINSVAERERFYMKRVSNIDYFIEKWYEHVTAD